MNNVHKLVYWIKERENIRLRKEADLAKPWTTDWVFQETYFCNVRREDDKVTRWLAKNWRSPHNRDEWLEYNMVLARFINWIPSLEQIGFQRGHKADDLKFDLHKIASVGKLWGNAYVITTHGQKMGKIDYLVDQVLTDAAVLLPANPAVIGDRCEDYWEYFRRIDGVGSFLAAQLVADLKNTTYHPLSNAGDFYSFSAPGPGSLRGLGWLFGRRVHDREYHERIEEAYNAVMPEMNIHLHMQDFQNCLCEFDKYMRVETGKGRSKRKYDGVD